MTDRLARKVRVYVPLCAAIALSLASGMSHGAVIHGCFNPSGGLRVIDPAKGQSCLPSEKPLDWNQAGSQGPTGPAGTNGTNGANGTNGVSGWEIVNQEFSLQIAQPNISALLTDVKCPADKRPISGGGYASWGPAGELGRLAVFSNIRILSNDAGYHVSGVVTRPDGGVFAIGDVVAGIAQAVCANVL